MDNHPCRLVLVGAGPDEGALKKLAQDLGVSAQVLFTGYVTPEEIPQYYAAADLFVLPSYSDVWGLVVNEAMVAGLPVIVTRDVGAAEDLVEHGGNGFIVDAKDSSALAKALASLLENQPLRKTMGNASYSRIMTNDMDSRGTSIGPILAIRESKASETRPRPMRRLRTSIRTYS